MITIRRRSKEDCRRKRRPWERRRSILSRRRPGGSPSTAKDGMFGQEVVRPRTIGICLCSSGGEGSVFGMSGVQLQQAPDDLAHVCGVEEGEQKQ
jgi:hypothetical protein